jgi:hypothetical protein
MQSKSDLHSLGICLYKWKSLPAAARRKICGFLAVTQPERKIENGQKIINISYESIRQKENTWFIFTGEPSILRLIHYSTEHRIVSCQRTKLACGKYHWKVSFALWYQPESRRKFALVFLLSLFFRPWRWRSCVLPKRRLTLNYNRPKTYGLVL